MSSSVWCPAAALLWTSGALHPLPLAAPGLCGRCRPWGEMPVLTFRPTSSPGSPTMLLWPAPPPWDGSSPILPAWVDARRGWFTVFRTRRKTPRRPSPWQLTGSCRVALILHPELGKQGTEAVGESSWHTGSVLFQHRWAHVHCFVLVLPIWQTTMSKFLRKPQNHSFFNALRFFFSLSLILFIYLFWLRRVFVASRGLLSSCCAPVSHCSAFSCYGARLGSGAGGLQ